MDPWSSSGVAARKRSAAIRRGKIQVVSRRSQEKQGHDQLAWHTRRIIAVLNRGEGDEACRGPAACRGLLWGARLQTLERRVPVGTAVSHSRLALLSPPLQRRAAAITLVVICQLLLPPHASRPRPPASPSFVPTPAASCNTLLQQKLHRSHASPAFAQRRSLHTQFLASPPSKRSLPPPLQYVPHGGALRVGRCGSPLPLSFETDGQPSSRPSAAFRRQLRQEET